MAGTSLFQVISTTLAILVAVFSGFDRKTKAKRTERHFSRRSTVCTTSESDDGTESNNSPGRSSVEEELKDLKEQMGNLMTLMEQIQNNLEHDKNQSGTKCQEEEEEEEPKGKFWIRGSFISPRSA